jgi:hypothetical protein
MIRRVASSAGLLLLFCVAAVASLKEVQTSADLAVDPKTGSPAVYFNAVLEYDPRPERADLSISWTLYVLEGGREETVSSTSRTSNRPSPGKIYLMSPPSWSNRGSVRCASRHADSANGFSPRLPLPCPLSFRSACASRVGRVERRRPQGVADEELEELVTIYNHPRRTNRRHRGGAYHVPIASFAPVQTYRPSMVAPAPDCHDLWRNAGVTLTVG